MGRTKAIKIQENVCKNTTSISSSPLKGINNQNYLGFYNQDQVVVVCFQ